MKFWPTPLHVVSNLWFKTKWHLDHNYIWITMIHIMDFHTIYFHCNGFSHHEFSLQWNFTQWIHNGFHTMDFHCNGFPHNGFSHDGFSLQCIFPAMDFHCNGFHTMDFHTIDFHCNGFSHNKFPLQAAYPAASHFNLRCLQIKCY